MRLIKTCSVCGCDRPHYGKDMCSMHYARWRRTGSTEAELTPKGEPKRFLCEVVLNHKDKKKCLTWPYSKSSGYATIRHAGKRAYKVTRLICRKIYGKAPTPEHYACHTCGKGHEGCVNPHHLYWGTPKQNVADRWKHGTAQEVFGERHGRAMLTELNVRKIRTLAKRGWSDTRIARRYGVTSQNIRHIRLHKTWKHVA